MVGNRVGGWYRNVSDEDAVVGIYGCLLYTSDAADERSSVDLGGRRIIKKKKHSSVWCNIEEIDEN